MTNTNSEFIQQCDNFEDAPNRIHVWKRFHERGITARDNNNLADAADQFQLAARVARQNGPNFSSFLADSLIALAEMGLKAKDYEAALKILHEVPETDSDSNQSAPSFAGEAWYLMATAYRALGRFEEAELHFERAWDCLKVRRPADHEHFILMYDTWLDTLEEWELSKMKAG